MNKKDGYIYNKLTLTLTEQADKIIYRTTDCAKFIVQIIEEKREDKR